MTESNLWLTYFPFLGHPVRSNIRVRIKPHLYFELIGWAFHRQPITNAFFGSCKVSTSQWKQTMHLLFQLLTHHKSKQGLAALRCHKNSGLAEKKLWSLNTKHKALEIRCQILECDLQQSHVSLSRSAPAPSPSHSYIEPMAFDFSSELFPRWQELFLPYCQAEVLSIV